ncbi:MAG: hypothetical protein ACO265_04665 [Polynucleobacter sp.]
MRQSGETDTNFMAKFKIGQTINFIQDSENPLKSPNTKLICAWLTCGGKLLDDSPFRYTVEKMDDGTERTNVVWLLDAATKVEFITYEPVKDSPNLFTKKVESIGFKEFQRRFDDEMWNEMNNEHPISFIHFYKENMRKMIGFLKDISPAIKIRTSKGVAVISKNTPEHIKKRILNEI